MKVTLRKAAALQTIINDAIKGIKLESSISLNEFQDAEAVIRSKSLELMANVNRQIDLTRALYTVRQAVGAANAANGVDDTLAEMALAEKTIRIYTELSNLVERADAMVIAGKLDKIRNRKEDSRASIYDSNEITTSVLTKDEIAVFKSKLAEAKKAKQKLQDKLLELNVRNEIELTQEVVDVLNKENLL